MAAAVLDTSSMRFSISVLMAVSDCVVSMYPRNRFTLSRNTLMMIRYMVVFRNPLIIHSSPVVSHFHVQLQKQTRVKEVFFMKETKPFDPSNILS